MPQWRAFGKTQKCRNELAGADGSMGVMGRVISAGKVCMEGREGEGGRGEGGERGMEGGREGWGEGGREGGRE